MNEYDNMHRDAERYRWLKEHMSFYKTSDSKKTTWQHLTSSKSINLNDAIDEGMNSHSTR